MKQEFYIGCNQNNQTSQLYNNSIYQIQMSINFTFKLLLILLLFTTLFSQLSRDCLTGCQQCKQAKSTCLMCRSQFQLSTSGQCISNNIPNCILYQNRLICIKCRPSFRLSNNRCIKMYDGCIQSAQLNLCSNCIQTTFLDKTTSSCIINELNCQQLGKNRKCIRCKQNYRLDTIRNVCIQNQSFCIRNDQNTGLCITCANGYTLLGFTCIKSDRLSNNRNCYLARLNQRTDNVECFYCKQGYLLVNGQCKSKSQILQVNRIQKCSQTTEYVDLNNKCNPMPLQCKFFDYGFKKCTFCQDGRTLIDGVCKKDVHKNCQQFSNSIPDNCQICRPKYYLNQFFQCISFPPYCQQVFRKKCVRCIDTFLLNSNSLCVDPNCAVINQMTGECNQCKNSFQKDLEGICIFIDPNCQLRRNSTCTLCKANFELNQKTGVCQYKDPNCIRNSLQGTCLQCVATFYYNSLIARCLKLPLNCIVADDAGICKQCRAGFVLTTSHQCSRINLIPNCKQTSENNSDICKICQSSYYLNSRGLCQLLPLFCLQYDAARNVCRTCDLFRARLQDGQCKDKNCQYLDFDGTCLGCYAGFQFGVRGQCKVMEKDPNCKEFQFDQCKKCSDKYYFDKQWKCVPVSQLCNQYDENSGLCLSCYPGYTLSEYPQGQCIVGGPTHSDSIKNDILNMFECKKQDQQSGNCTQCQQNYQLVKTTSNRIICSKISDSSFSGSCLQFRNKKCSKCIARRFLNKNGLCEQIDQNCQKFDAVTGQCFTCYSGYQLQNVINIKSNTQKKACLLKVQKDPKCKISTNGTNGTEQKCLQCYPGYYFSQIKKSCQLNNKNCQTYNQTNGYCLTCFYGYKIQNGECKLVLSADSNNSMANSSSLSQICIRINAAGLCQQCIGGYINNNGRCMKKDLNCRKFKDQIKSLECEECYQGFIVHPKDSTKCIQQNKIDGNCLQYDQNLLCTKCKLGMTLILNQNGISICQSIKRDLLCVNYDSTKFQCLKCVQNAVVMQNGACDYPLYGHDINCLTYRLKICVECKQNYSLTGYMCIKNN